MKRLKRCIRSVLWALLCLPQIIQADVSVLLQIDTQQVELQRIHRRAVTAAELSRQAIRQARSEAWPTVVENSAGVDALLFNWYDLGGVLLHSEVRRDPRFTHGPNGQAVMLRTAAMLIRGPSSAVRLDIRPSGFTEFITFNVMNAYPNE